MTRQTSIPGTSPPRDEALEELIEERFDLEEQHKRTAESLKMVNARIVQMMISAKYGKYEAKQNGRSVFASLKLSDPTVQLRVIETGNDDEDDGA